jgi:hypothetical protein
MMRFLIPAAALAACSNSPTNGATAWQDALDRAQISLRDSVQVAEGDGASAKKATLRTDGGGVFSVTALANQAFDDVRVDAVSGTIVSKEPIAFSADDCAGAISLADAISAAEKQVGGEAVQAGPDDDGHCNTEVIVLSGDKLWEVKIGPKGDLVEDPEEADSNEGPDGEEG